MSGNTAEQTQQAVQMVKMPGNQKSNKGDQNLPKEIKNFIIVSSQCEILQK